MATISKPLDITPTKSKETPKVNLKYERDKEREMVRGIFRFHEVPGGSMSFVYKKYKEDPVERYDFLDGQIYTVPLGVARHLNKTGKYPVHAYRQNENGQASQYIGSRVSRYGFQSLEFVDIDDESATGSVREIVEPGNIRI